MLKNLIEKSFYQNRELNQLTFTRLKKNIINGSSILKKKILKKKNIYIIGLLGKGGGRVKKFCDLKMIIPSEKTTRIQEFHLLIGHIMCEFVD